MSIWKKVEEADSLLVKRARAYEVASVPETIPSLAIEVEVPTAEFMEVEVALKPGTSRYEESVSA